MLSRPFRQKQPSKARNLYIWTNITAIGKASVRNFFNGRWPNSWVRTLQQRAVHTWPSSDNLILYQNWCQVPAQSAWFQRLKLWKPKKITLLMQALLSSMLRLYQSRCAGVRFKRRELTKSSFCWAFNNWLAVRWFRQHWMHRAETKLLEALKNKN